MAPKRRSAKVVKTVVTTKKVVEEIVKVVVTPGSEDGNKKAELLSSSTKESQNIEISTPSPDHVPEPASGTIQIQEKPTPPQDETQPDSDPETAPTPPQKPEEKKKAAGKMKAGGGEKGAGAGKRRRKRGGGGGGGYKRYVFLVMKQVHPGMGISSKAMTIIDNLMVDMFGRLAEEAGQLLKFTRRQTMTSREVQGAVKLVLPGELGKHAIAEGIKAVTNYVSYVSGEQK